MSSFLLLIFLKRLLFYYINVNYYKLITHLLIIREEIAKYGKIFLSWIISIK